MEIIENKDDHGICLRITRTLDLTNASDLHRALGRLFDETDEPLWIDISDMQSVDSAGLTLWLKWHRKALSEERRFALVRTNSYHRKLLEITRLDRELMVYDEPGGRRLPPRPSQGFARRISLEDENDVTIELLDEE